MIKTSKDACNDCEALCCQGLTIDIKKPRTRDEVETLLWQLHYDTVGIYILNKRWHLFVEGRCGYLDDNDRCTRYERRNDICRRHNPPECEKYLDWYDVMFDTPEELEAYIKKEKKKKMRKKRKK